ncbi:Lipase 1-like protein [Cladobotryum mycophilum]|uniref:Lipase 1-like protein n=1 Tax=Cladobotryum mycophilum TaxID=491253 RepID=A0ABR0T0U0_9HYPO
MASLRQIVPVLAVLGCASAVSIPVTRSHPPPPPQFNLPKSYAALGDSFASGIGSGLFLNNSADKADVECLRQDGSYPSQLLELGPFDGEPTFQFTACAGDELDDIDGQVAKLGHSKFDLLTLTIGGNDFGFSDIATTCVYATTQTPGIKDFQKACDAAFDIGFAKIADQANWDKYAQKLALVKKSLNPGGRLFVTNYPKFFAQPQVGDVCDSISFFPIPQFAALNMTAQNRLRANDLTEKINKGIKRTVLSTSGPEVRLVDFDKIFEGKRFCEPANDNDPIGANNPNVFFNDLTTVLAVPGIAKIEKQTPGLTGVDITDQLQQVSTNHPKAGAHRVLAAGLNFRILLDSFLPVQKED